MRINMIFLLFLLTACAGTVVKPVVVDKDATGIRFYQPAPYLLVYADGQRHLNSKLIYLPDTTKKMSVRTYAYFATNDSNLTFNKGILTDSVVDINETQIPAALLDAALTLAGAAASAAFNTPGGKREKLIPGPWLFKIVVDQNGTRLEGGSGFRSDGKEIIIRVNPTDPNGTVSSLSPQTEG